MIDKKEIKSITMLLDDPDPVVKECVGRRLEELGEEGLKALDSFSRHAEGERKRLIRQKMEELNTFIHLERFSEFIRREKEVTFSLFESSLTVAGMFDVKFKSLEYETLIFSLVGELSEELSEDRTAVENCRIFSHIFYNRMHFEACDTLVTSEKDALLYDVLKERRGNPVAIAMIFFTLAQECGLPIYPVCFPGGFVPSYIEKGKRLFYINIYQKGELFAETKFREYLSMQGMGIDASKTVLRSRRAVLGAYLESLLYIYSGRDSARYAVIEKALDLLGEERILSIDEEQED